MTVTIDRLDCGSLTAASAMFESGGPDAPVTVPVPAWLIRHPQGNVLFDCGMHPDLTTPGPLLDLVSLFFTVGLDDDQLIARALAANGVSPHEIDLVVLSHLHFDHAGGLVELPDARLVVQGVEWRAGFDSDLEAANSFRRDDYDLGHDVLAIDGEHDLFGDGLVTCVPTPGHTPGHQSLRVRLADREVVLCGDCAYFERTLDGGPLPPISYDPASQADSLAMLRSMRTRGTTLVPGHDPVAFAALPIHLV